MADSDRPALADRAGLVELRALVREILRDQWLDPALAGAGGAGTSGTGARTADTRTTHLMQASHSEAADARQIGTVTFPKAGGRNAAAEPETTRTAALVELAQKGDTEAFGQLYDHYLSTVYRYVYYRVGTHAVTEDLTSETFLRALRSLHSFRWQGRDFGAWLVTIARNLITDHFKSGRFRLEVATGEVLDDDSVSDGPEDEVLASLTNEALIGALKQLRSDQQECLVLRFLNGLSVAETAGVIGKSEGAVKQLQLRAVRNLAKLLPDGLR